MTENPITTMLSWDNLYNWASDQPIAGHANSSHYCPIARYLNDVTDELWTVDDGQAAILHSSGEAEGETYSLPQWAKIVADVVDAVERDRITREQFLAIMVVNDPKH